MRASLKITLSLLISVILFSGFALLAYSGLFSIIESYFFQPRIKSEYQARVSALREKVIRYHDTNRERYRSQLQSEFITRSFQDQQVKEDIDQRDRYFTKLKEEFPNFLFCRLVGAVDRRIHFSSLELDIKEKRDQRVIYHDLRELEDEAVIQALLVDETTDFKFKIGALNKYLGGLDKGELLTIGGYTSQAKSGLGVQMAINQAIKGRRVLFLSTEMLVPEVGRRILGNQCGINITNMRRGLMTPDETAYAKETTKIIGQDWKMNIKKIYSIDDVFKYVRKYKPEILFLDYIQNLSGESDYKTITQNMKLLQSITFQNEISTVCISQLNRNKEEIREPRLTDLRDSGRLEECSNMVIFLYWKERLQLKNKQRMGGEPPEQIEIIVGKNRDGACGRFMINFYPEYARFEDQAFEEYDNYKE